MTQSEAGSIEVERRERTFPIPREQVGSEATGYYGVPMLKEPVWKWYVPTYFHFGGAAGAAMVLGASAMLDPSHSALSKRCAQLGAAGSMLGAVLLTADLGRPSRFINMMRVFRPTSPMNLGTWVLAGASAASAAGAIFDGAMGRAAVLGAGALGLPLSGYTAVLLANTANPAWQRARTVLPPLFVASSISGAASLLELLPASPESARLVRRFGGAGRLAELAFSSALPAEYRRGRAHRLLSMSKLATAASLALSLASRSRKLRIGAGLLGTIGSLLLRFGVSAAGHASAKEPLR